jgi:hypothetical protein
MNLNIVIICVIVIMIGLFFVLNYKSKDRVIENPIIYPKWFVFLKVGLWVIGGSCFIWAAVLASQPKTPSVKVCIYTKK